jgi:hypothetical protein
MRLALVIAAVATIWLGVVPGRVLNHASLAAVDLQPKSRAAGKVQLHLDFRNVAAPGTSAAATQAK